MTEIQTLGVIGAGTMGCGIAEVAAVAGLKVLVVDTDVHQLERALKRITASVEKGIARGKLDVESPAAVVDRIELASKVAGAHKAGFCIEAVIEDEAVKRDVFAELGGVCRQEVILASNTSSISITKLAAASGRPEQVIGMHFFNPVQVMTPVEVVVGLETSAETAATTRRLAERLGKTPLECKDSPGFVVNRMLMPLVNEAAFALAEGVADTKTIDELLVRGCRHPMGPLALADLIGIDVCLAILEVLHRDLGDPKFRPCPLLRRMVDAGRLGRKSGRGFHEYG